jgi:hypothetical protein
MQKLHTNELRVKNIFFDYAKKLMPTRPKISKLQCNWFDKERGVLIEAQAIATCKYKLNGVETIDQWLLKFDGVEVREYE